MYMQCKHLLQQSWRTCLHRCDLYIRKSQLISFRLKIIFQLTKAHRCLPKDIITRNIIEKLGYTDSQSSHWYSRAILLIARSPYLPSILSILGLYPMRFLPFGNNVLLRIMRRRWKKSYVLKKISTKPNRSQLAGGFSGISADEIIHRTAVRFEVPCKMSLLLAWV